MTDPSNIAQIGTTGAGRIFQYATGWVLFSKDDPTHILTRAEEPILVPEKDWERFGQVDNVVFSEGLVNYNDIWYLYYGGADTRIGVARCEGPIYIGVDEYEQREFLSYSLTRNYPNPFNVTISIELSLKDCGKVSLKVLDLVGREVTTLVDRQMEAGTHRVIWKPVGLPSGVYFYVLSVNGLEELRKLIFLK
ncbi:T9SS type A sorting domain-containing protein [candidate division WOR-3 bacterium]|nr:T9SS type A sorting domain-containing protein [candidate division WOR-3 bacterium]